REEVHGDGGGLLLRLRDGGRHQRGGAQPDPAGPRRSALLQVLQGKPEATVDRTLDTKVFKGWVETDNPWTSDDETDNAEMTYVNLQLNPERYTGYTGDSARRIWDAIYKENCPKYPSEDMCQEKKALYKLISGLHSSISVHIAYDYLLDESANLVSIYYSTLSLVLIRRFLYLI
uniref:Uncharacterized protein n=1 Tax=Aegilops tauschii subsp. strangulata TaxID=200361 RepID=A0A453HBQ5_AEGTS